MPPPSPGCRAAARRRRRVGGRRASLGTPGTVALVRVAAEAAEARGVARGGGGVAAAVLVPRCSVDEALRQYLEEASVALRRRQIGHTPSTAAVSSPPPSPPSALPSSSATAAGGRRWRRRRGGLRPEWRTLSYRSASEGWWPEAPGRRVAAAGGVDPGPKAPNAMCGERAPSSSLSA